ncbi:hypothetical protein [Deinococcus arenae]|uniref:hypothetical protein n=1 Tax=Deinococcus arenae TaxID=1452751 RepID=UPI0016641A2E|nr:hypothetical protein [Deinococcus arenae]
MCTAALLRLGLTLLAEFEPHHPVAATIVCFVTTDPELGLTFHARTRRGPPQAGRATITSAALHQHGVQPARDALTYLLQMVAQRGLPGVDLTEPTPLVGLWSASLADVVSRRRDDVSRSVAQQI